MSDHRRHGRHGHHGEASSNGGYGAPTYNFDPMQQAAYGQQQMVPEPYGMQGFQQPGYYGAPTSYGQQQVMPYPGQHNNLQAEHRLKQNEHRAEMGAVGALAFAAYEKHQEKVDPANAHRHHVEMQVAEAAALGLGGYALYEHHEASKLHKQDKHHGHKHERKQEKHERKEEKHHAHKHERN